jgi:hypothetical protein
VLVMVVVSKPFAMATKDYVQSGKLIGLNLTVFFQKLLHYNLVSLIISIRIISDKYIVTCDDDGVLKIWDFQAALIHPEPFNSNFLIRQMSHLRAIPRAASVKPSVVSSKVKRIDARKKTPRVPPIEYMGSTCMVADELQMILVSHSEDGSSYLHVETFLNAA